MLNFKNKKDCVMLIVLVIVLIIIVCGVSVYATSTYMAGQVKYTDTKTVEQALNELYAQQKNGINTDGYYQFVKGNNGFATTLGQVEFNTLGVIPTNYDIVNERYGLKVAIEKELDKTIVLNDKFEISSEISFDNRATEHVGGIRVFLYQKVENNYNEVAMININDAWSGSNNIAYDSSISSNYVVNNLQWSTLNGSGRYGLVCDKQKAYFYRDNILLGNINYTSGISVDKIKIEFSGYSNTYVAPPFILKDLYVGKPLFYKSIIGE